MKQSINTPPSVVATESFGGPAKLAKALGLTTSAVSKWERSGMVPVKHMATILKLAKYRRIKLTPEDLVNGRTKK